MYMISLHGFVAEALAAPASSVLGGCLGHFCLSLIAAPLQGLELLLLQMLPQRSASVLPGRTWPVLDGCCQLGVSVLFCFCWVVLPELSQCLVLLC